LRRAQAVEEAAMGVRQLRLVVDNHRMLSQVLPPTRTIGEASQATEADTMPEMTVTDIPPVLGRLTAEVDPKRGAEGDEKGPNKSERDVGSSQENAELVEPISPRAALVITTPRAEPVGEEGSKTKDESFPAMLLDDVQEWLPAAVPPNFAEKEGCTVSCRKAETAVPPMTVTLELEVTG
jgi:hypothetical protein